MLITVLKTGTVACPERARLAPELAELRVWRDERDGLAPLLYDKLLQPF
jgi:hypothetical protein